MIFLIINAASIVATVFLAGWGFVVWGLVMADRALLWAVALLVALALVRAWHYGEYVFRVSEV